LGAERLRTSNHLVKRSQNDRVPGILYDHVTAMSQAVLPTKFGR
jgi:hypothetical protein